MRIFAIINKTLFETYEIEPIIVTALMGCYCFERFCS